MKIKYFLLAFALIFVSCSKKQEEFVVASGNKGSTYYNSLQEIKHIWNKYTPYTIKDCNMDKAVSSNFNIELLADDKVDMCIAQNDAIKQLRRINTNEKKFSNIRTLLPLYPEILYIIYKDTIEAENIFELIENRTVAMGPKNSGTANFVLHFLNEFGLDTTKYNPYFPLNWDHNTFTDSVDVVFILSAPNYEQINILLNDKNGKLFSMGKPEQASAGSAVDGFCWNYQNSKPFIIPIGSYNGKPEKPILTVAVDAVLFTNKDIDKNIIYNLVETIINNKQSISTNNVLLSEVSSDFDKDNLSFPIHAGTRMYLERNKPTFLQEWSEPMALIFSVLIALFGGVKSVVTWNKLHKKNRIDKYYKILIDTQDNIVRINSNDELEKEINKLIDLRKRAFQELIKERLIADESFKIFTELLDTTINDLRLKSK